MKSSLFRTLLTTTLLGIAATGSLCAMNGGDDDIPWEKQSKKAAPNQTQPHGAEHQKHDSRQQHSTAQPSSSSASACSSANATPTPLRGMNLGVGLGTGIAANIDTDEQKTMQPASTSSSSTATANDSSSSTSLRKQGRLHGSAQEIVFGDPQSPILDCIASFLVGSNSTDPAQMVAAFFKPASFWQHNGRTDFFNFQQVNKAVYKSLEPTVQKIHKILFESGGEELGKLLLAMSKQGTYQAVKVIIENLQRLKIPLATIHDADGNNALHLASSRNDLRMRRLILTADQALDQQRNLANQTPYQQCSERSKVRLQTKNTLLYSLGFGLFAAFLVTMSEKRLLPGLVIGTAASVLIGIPTGIDAILSHPGSSETEVTESIKSDNFICLGITIIVIVWGMWLYLH